MEHPLTVEEEVQRTHLPKPVVITFAHLDPVALGVSLGLLSGLLLFAATAILVARGGDPLGPNLWLLAQYFPGFSVTWAGAAIGFIYAAIGGFLFGYLFAMLRNFLNHLYLVLIRRHAQREAFNDLL